MVDIYFTGPKMHALQKAGRNPITTLFFVFTEYGSTFFMTI